VLVVAVAVPVRSARTGDVDSAPTQDVPQAANLAAGTVVTGPAADRPPTPQERMTAQGFVRYRGMWRTVQEIDLIERADRDNLARKDWNGRLERLRKRLDEPAQSDAAAEEIREIADPAAVPALAAALAREPVPRVRGFCIEALSRIRGGEAAAALVAVAVDHVDPETRILAVERLAALGPEAAAAGIVPALGSDDNARVNRAAEALGRLGAGVAIVPLIAALETEHVVVAGAGAPEGSTSATFTPSGGGLSMGGGPKRRKTRVQNPRVLEALVALTGVNYHWDEAAWRAWLAGRQAPPDVDLRRG
jgi:HEAT repeat protein